jgi:hypothetical protein
MSDVSSEPILVIPTCRKYDPFAAELARVLPAFWPDHPQHWIITDGDESARREVVSMAGDRSWVDLLRDGLKEIENRRGSLPDYLYLVLEDLMPLGQVPVAELQSCVETARRHSLDEILFATYPWKRLSDSDGNFLSFKSHRFTAPPQTFDDTTLFPIHPSLRWTCQVQPAIWRTSHLLNLCEQAIHEGIGDPWGFEMMRPPAGSPAFRHYIADFRWPSVWNGLFVEGHVNPTALRKIMRSSHDLSALQGMLLKRAAGQFPANLIYLMQKFPKEFYGAASNRIRRLRRKIRGQGSDFPEDADQSKDS